MNADLRARATAYGVQTSYRDWRGEPHEVPEDTVRLVLDAMGDPPAAATTKDKQRCPTREELGRCWGWTAQLYAVRSRASWGIGDLADLADLARWSGSAGADFVLVNPLHAAAPVLPQQPSPYFPSSRRFVNPLYLRPEGTPPPYDPVRLLDRDAVFAAKDAALRSACPGRTDPHDQGLEDFATFCALARRHGTPYQSWPAELRHPRSEAVARARRELADEIGYHAWLQQRCDEQLAAAQRAALDSGMRVGVVHDLAVGVDPGGADAWALQDDLAPGMTVGAPPDSFNPRGQDWRVPPLRPDRVLGPWRDLLRATLRHGGGIRIDHAIGLFRLWWIPAGASPAEGTYVRYPAEALLGVLAEETRRTGAVAVAEDLGTLEPGVSETLRAWGLHTSAVLLFDEEYPPQSLASVTTHDLPTAAGYWTDTRVPEKDRVRLRALLGDPADPVLAMHEHVARTPARLFGVALGDATGDLRHPNLPGTLDEYPNWRLPLADAAGRPVLLDDLPDHPGVRRTVELLQELRRRASC